MCVWKRERERERERAWNKVAKEQNRLSKIEKTMSKEKEIEKAQMCCKKILIGMSQAVETIRSTVVGTKVT